MIPIVDLQSKILFVTHKTRISNQDPAVIDALASIELAKEKTTTIGQAALNGLGSMTSPTGLIINGGILGGLAGYKGGDILLTGLIQLVCNQVAGGEVLAMFLTSPLLAAFGGPFNVFLAGTGSLIVFGVSKTIIWIREKKEVNGQQDQISINLKEIKQLIDKLDISADDRLKIMAWFQKIENQQTEQIIEEFYLMDLPDPSLEREMAIVPVEEGVQHNLPLSTIEMLKYKFKQITSFFTKS